MPLHDWSGESAEAFHDFHLRWTGHLVESLNSGLLPDALFARLEPGASMERPIFDRRGSNENENSRLPDGEGGDGGGVLTVAASPPETDILLDDVPYLRQQRSVRVRRTDGSLVAAVEIASEANLSSVRRRDELAAKLVAMVRGGVHVCLLNPHAAAGREPTVEWMVMDGLALKPVGRAAEEAMMTSVVSRLADAEFEAPAVYADRVRVGEPLRPLPLFVGEQSDVPLPLEETYGRTFAGLPRRVRERLGAGR